MKKLITLISALLTISCCVTQYPANADLNTPPEDYAGYAESIYINGYIFKMKDINKDVNFNYLNIDNSSGNYQLCSVELTGEKEIGYDSFYEADFSDEKYDGFQKSENKTGLYYITVPTAFEKLKSNPDIEEIYYVYEINRNGCDSEGRCQLLGGGHKKIFKSDELVKNDANNDGIVNSADALKVLQSIVQENKLTIKEKIQLNVTYSSNYIDYENYNNLTSEQALDILYQIVNE